MIRLRLFRRKESTAAPRTTNRSGEIPVFLASHHYFTKSHFYLQLTKKCMIKRKNLYFEELKIVASDRGLYWAGLGKKKILITGASGMIGSYIVDLLMMRNHLFDDSIEVFALSRNMDKLAKKFLCYQDKDSLHIIEQDICNTLMLETDVDYIIHAASNTHPLEYAKKSVETITTNVVGLNNIYEYARNKPGCRVVVLSSVEIYGENRGDVDGFDESYCGYIDCNTLRAGYPESKRLCETMAQAYNNQYGIDSVIVRLSRIYGPGVEDDDSKAMTQFINKAINHEDIVLKSDGSQLYSYTYIADAVRAILKVMLEGKSGQAYNVADDTSDKTLKDIAEFLASISGSKVIYEIPNESESRGYSTVTKAVLAAKKIKRLGWKPLFSMEEGLRQTLNIMD